MNEKLIIGHLYPDLMNLYGDRGNVLALMRRAKLRGIDVEIKSISIGDSLGAGDFDLGFFGGGQDSEQNVVKEDLVSNKGAALRQMIEDGTVFLCICGGYQMLGKYYVEHDGTRLDCLGIIDIYTEGKNPRFINDTIYTCDYIGGATVVGFENHSGRTYLGEGVKPFMKVVQGHGNNGEDGYEGAVYKNTFCTYSHGSILPKNPLLTDMLLSLALKRKYGDSYELPPLSTEFEDLASKVALNYIAKGSTR